MEERNKGQKEKCIIQDARWGPQPKILSKEVQKILYYQEKERILGSSFGWIPTQKTLLVANVIRKNVQSEIPRPTPKKHKIARQRNSPVDSFLVNLISDDKFLQMRHIHVEHAMSTRLEVPLLVEGNNIYNLLDPILIVGAQSWYHNSWKHDQEASRLAGSEKQSHRFADNWPQDKDPEPSSEL